MQQDQPEDRLHSLQPDNPVARSWAQGRFVDEAWLTARRPLTNIQRLGFLAISTFIGVGACSLAIGGIDNIRDGNIATGVIMAGVGLVCICLASRGIWRVWWDVFRRS
jgi:hypothetical protein